MSDTTSELRAEIKRNLQVYRGWTSDADARTDLEHRIDEIEALLADQKQRWADELRKDQHLYNVKSTDGVLNEPNTGVLAIPVAALDGVIGGQQ